MQHVAIGGGDVELEVLWLMAIAIGDGGVAPAAYEVLAALLLALWRT